VPKDAFCILIITWSRSRSPRPINFPVVLATIDHIHPRIKAHRPNRLYIPISYGVPHRHTNCNKCQSQSIFISTDARMCSIQFQIMSDLHLETPEARPTYDAFKIQPQHQYLALLGILDCLASWKSNCRTSRSSSTFEPYGMTFPAARATVRAIEEETKRLCSLPNTATGRFVFLDRTRYDLNDSVTVLGCTLFSLIVLEQRESVARFVADFSRIEDWTVESHSAAHQADLQWLNGQVEDIMQYEPHRSIIILTHHSPTMLEAANDPGHVKDLAGVRSAFVTDLSDQVCWTSLQVKLWAFGHTHFNCDFQEVRTAKRVVANQKGYCRTELLTFDATKTILRDTGVWRSKGTRGRVGLKPKSVSSSEPVHLGEWIGVENWLNVYVMRYSESKLKALAPAQPHALPTYPDQFP